MKRKFKVKVHIKRENQTPSFMYWTWSGSTVNIDDAVIFTEETVPSFFKQSLEQPYVEKLYLE